MVNQLWKRLSARKCDETRCEYKLVYMKPHVKAFFLSWGRLSEEVCCLHQPSMSDNQKGQKSSLLNKGMERISFCGFPYSVSHHGTCTHQVLITHIKWFYFTTYFSFLCQGKNLLDSGALELWTVLSISSKNSWNTIRDDGWFHIFPESLMVFTNFLSTTCRLL